MVEAVVEQGKPVLEVMEDLVEAVVQAQGEEALEDLVKAVVD